MLALPGVIHLAGGIIITTILIIDYDTIISTITVTYCYLYINDIIIVIRAYSTMLALPGVVRSAGRNTYIYIYTHT